MSSNNRAEPGDDKGSNEAASAELFSHRLYCVKPGDEPEPLEEPVSRLVAVDDPDVPKIALVMDDQLCEAFYAALGAWNDAQIDAREHQAKLLRLQMFMRYAQKGIWTTEAKCADIEQDHTKQCELSLLVRRCNEYKLMLNDAEDEVEFLDQQLAESERSAKEWLDYTFVMIQEVCIAKGTMQPDPEDITIEPAFLSRWSVPEGDSSLRDLPVVEAKAANELICAKIELQAAQRDFDNRKTIPYEYYADPQEQVDYDLQRLQQNMNLTQDLVQAEKRVADAKAQRRRQCNRISASDQSSALQDREQDSRYLSGVCESLQGPDNQTAVCQWLQSLPNVLLVEELEPTEVDQWEFRSICIEDSRSMVDEGRGRDRIDAYKKASEELRIAAFEDLLDTYFATFHNQPYSFFHEPMLKERAIQLDLPDYLVGAIAALAIRFSQDVIWTGVQAEAGRGFARSSWETIARLDVDSDESCSHEIVQATTLLFIYDFVEGRQRGAWVKLGLAVRVSQSLSLMDEPSAKLSYAEQEERRRTFCNTAEDTEGLAAYTATQTVNLLPPSPLARVLIVASVLSRCSMYAIKKLEMDSQLPPWDAGSEYQKISSALLHLESQLGFEQPLREVSQMYEDATTASQHSTEPILFSNILFHLCQCLLTHFCLLSQRLNYTLQKPPLTFLRLSLQSNFTHAIALSDVLQQGIQLGCPVRGSFTGYAALISGTILAVHGGAQAVRGQQESKLQLESILRFLQRQSVYWPNHTSIVLCWYNALVEFQNTSFQFEPLLSNLETPVTYSAEVIEKMALLTDYGALSDQKRHTKVLFDSSETADQAIHESLQPNDEMLSSYDVTDFDLSDFWPADEATPGELQVMSEGAIPWSEISSQWNSA
ncbi:hypothetical protein Slin15195_G104850 [Septoria linicola]|uniref:Xylanolytic transcriptional activator regulatory domain-containing protein n=1 Tax=Septoria linicola TaxID=215465 RepID=A0A9Q9EMV9_9PEZI|nr:hypothetical protein Slin15195_G104850 [Septoria linicola]